MCEQPWLLWTQLVEALIVPLLGVVKWIEFIQVVSSHRFRKEKLRQNLHDSGRSLSQGLGSVPFIHSPQHIMARGQ